MDNCEKLSDKSGYSLALKSGIDPWLSINWNLSEVQFGPTRTDKDEKTC